MYTFKPIYANKLTNKYRAEDTTGIIIVPTKVDEVPEVVIDEDINSEG